MSTAYTPEHHTTEPPAKKKKRIFMWVVLAVQALFIAWIAAGLAGSGSDDTCAGKTGDALALCQDAAAVGTGIGVFLIIGLWFAVNAFLLVGYGLFRLSARRD